ncbi:MAG: ATP-binding protein [Verrucomicrobiota bacterium]|jgi:PAS domain S-box-containing protein
MNNPATARNSRLLIVDDNHAIHDDFRKILSRHEPLSGQIEKAEAVLFGEVAGNGSACTGSFQLDSAYQGKDGLRLVQEALQQGRPYAMAFVDVRMPPGWDGVETTARIWEIDPDLQVVICTAYSDCSWGEMLERLGRSDRLVILRKPFDNVEVLQLANSLTRKWQLLQESKGKMTGLEEMVVARTAQMVQEQEKFKAIFENSPEGIFQTTLEGRILTANPALAGIFGYASPKELMEQLTDMHRQLYVDAGRLAEFQTRLQREKIVREFQSEIKCKDGSRKWISETACEVTKLDGSLLHYQGFVVDITAQKSAQKERDLIETQLRQAQKLESVGQLAAGIAHEINTPIQYIGDNIHFIEESFAALSGLLQEYQKLAAAVRTNTVTPAVLSAVESSIQKTDLDYLSKEIPLAVEQSLQGVSHVSHIVNAMKEFSHPGSREKVALDLNHAIEMTVTVARGEWKYVAEMVTDFAPGLPPVPCLPGEFNQVILNLIINAAHAIGEVVKPVNGSKGTIRISTRLDGAWVEIRISDTGTGIPEEIRDRIFDPFFTTKEVGKGTGQGLTIARSVIVDKHGGALTFESEVGRGTTFIIRLPATGSAVAGKKT